MVEKDGRRAYRSFLLRMWRNNDSTWRFSIEDTVTGIRKGFSSLGMLMDYLQDSKEYDGQTEADSIDT